MSFAVPAGDRRRQTERPRTFALAGHEHQPGRGAHQRGQRQTADRLRHHEHPPAHRQRTGSVAGRVRPFLNSLTGPAQLLVAAQRHDLTAYAQTTADFAPRLPHPALQTAADDYAAFLLDLDAERDPLHRQVLAVVTGEHAGDAAVRALSGLGVEAAALDGPAVASALATALDPFNPPVPGPRAVPGTPITGSV